MLRLSAFLVSLLLAGTAAAQTTPVVTSLHAPAASLPGVLGPRQTFRLNAGFLTAGRLGTASYLNPEAAFRLTNRLTVFTGVTYVRATPGILNYPTYALDDRAPANWVGTNHYFVQAGVQYAVSPRLALTGTAWKDLSTELPRGPIVNPYAGFNGNMGSGMSLRADYMVTEHLSISGGLRISNGAAGLPGSGYFPSYTPGLP